MLLLTAAFAYAQVDVTQDWDAGDAAGWSNRSANVTLSNPTNYLRATFAPEFFPSFGEDVLAADLGQAVLLTNIAFRMRAVDLPGSELRFMLMTHGGETWYLRLPPPAGAGWTNYAVAVNYATGWFRGPGATESDFSAALRDVVGIGLMLRRNSSPWEQSYDIDDMRLRGLAITPGDRDGDGMPDDWEAIHALNADDPNDGIADTDGDGLSNYGEYRAGTDPGDPDSVLAVDVVPYAALQQPVEGFVVRWASATGRSYTVWRSLSVTEPPAALATNLSATPPTNVFTDVSATNPAAYYRIGVE